MGLRQRVFGVVAAGIVAGCSSLGGSPPPPIYDLTAPRDFPGLTGRANVQILVPEPKAVKALDTESMAIKPSPAVITYYGDGQWSDSLPKLVQARLVEAFENSGRVRAIGRPGDGLLIHYQIATEIRAFQLELKGGRRAVIEMMVKILNDKNGHVLATQTFHAEVPSSSDKVDAAVAAMDSAFQEVLVDIVRWVVTRL